ncbi:MAG: hypothetical protein Q7R99_00130 [bacterium]|nr:hypothetical protein [bacterium]
MKSYKPSHLQKKIKVRKKAIKRKRFLKSRLFFDILLWVIFFLLLAYLVLFSGVLKINNIQIVSSQEIPNERVSQIVNSEMQKRVLFFIKKDSFFLIDAKKISQIISNEFPQALKVEVKRGLPGSIFIEIKPRIAQTIWCFTPPKTDTAEADFATTTSCFLVDQQRIIFASFSLDSPKNNLIMVSSELAPKAIFSEVCTSSLIERIIETNKVLNDFGLSNSIFIEKANGFLNVKTMEGWEAFFNPKQDLVDDMLKLRLLLEKEITAEKRKTLEYIDLRFSKAYYK